MKCEKCGNEHDGSFGSGRFCNKSCACSYSTKEKRQEINKKVSEKLKKTRFVPEGFKKGYDPRRGDVSKRLSAPDIIAKRTLTSRKNYEYRIMNSPFKELSLKSRRLRILLEQENKCNICGISSWNDKKIILHLHHKDGDKNNENRENFESICPNCHSQTSTYCSKNVSDEGRKIMRQMAYKNFHNQTWGCNLRVRLPPEIPKIPE